MRLAFHGATSMTSDIITDVKASTQAGFAALEIWASEMDDYLREHTIDYAFPKLSDSDSTKT